jgi:hypothetical protein
MIHSRKAHQFKITQEILNDDNHPLVWTEETLSRKTNNEVIIGYLFKNKMGQFGVEAPVLNMYTINPKYLSTPNKTISLSDLQCVYMDWLLNKVSNDRCLRFKNPPIKEWMDTKDNWVKKLANKLSNRYNRPYDECLSSVNMTIMKCYSKGHVYMGNLAYIETAADNDIKMEYRFNKNRLTCDNPITFSMDDNVEGTKDDSSEITYHDILGKVDPYYEEQDFEDFKATIIKDLKQVFSDREIDQILNAPGYLTMTIYRKLMNWRKKHKPEDYKHE